METLFKGIVLPKNKTVKNDLFVRMKAVNTRGIANFIFSKPILQITNYSLIEEKKVI